MLTTLLRSALLLSALLLSALLLPALPLRAQRVSFDEAIGLSASAPRVHGEERALEEREAGDARISDITEASRIVAMPGVRVLTEDDRGFEGQLQLGHSWNLAGLSDAQRRTARHERGAREARARALALEQRLAAARAWMTLHEAETRLLAAREAVAVAERVLDRTQRARAAGVTTAADEAEARAFVAEAHTVELAVYEEIVEGQVTLGAALGRGDVETLGTLGALPEPAVPDAAEIEQRLADVTHVAEVQAAQLSALAGRARAIEVAAARGPRLDADVMLYREAPAGMMIFGQIGLSLPLVDLAARERSMAQEEAALREAQAEETALAWRREAHRVAHDVEHSQRVLARHRDELVPALVALLEVRERQLAVGETTTLWVLEATRRLVSGRAALARAQTLAAWAATRAWLLLATHATHTARAAAREETTP